MVSRKGQAELLGLAGIALLALAVLADFMFFGAPSVAPKLNVELEGNTTLKACVNSVAKLKLRAFNPATNPPATVTIDVKVSNATVAAVVDGKPATLPLVTTLAPGQSLEVNLYFSPSAPGAHQAVVRVAYTLNGMVHEKTFELTVVGERCG